MEHSPKILAREEKATTTTTHPVKKKGIKSTGHFKRRALFWVFISMFFYTLFKVLERSETGEPLKTGRQVGLEGRYYRPSQTSDRVFPAVKST